MSDIANPETSEELGEALDRLLLAAYANGVEVDGGYILSHSNLDIPDWGLQISHSRK